MSYVRRHAIVIAVDASGDGTGFTPIVNGKIVNVRYVKTDYADGMDVVVTLSATAQAVWTGTDVNASVTVAPRQATHDTVGAASLYAAGGEPVEDYIWAGNDKVKIVVALGGVSKTGTFHVTVA